MKTWYELFKDKITMVVSLGLLDRLEVMDRPVDSVEHQSGTYALKHTGEVLYVPRKGVAIAWQPSQGGQTWEMIKSAMGSAGAPRKQRIFMLTDDEYENLRKVGGGNATAGVRELIRNFKI